MKCFERLFFCIAGAAMLAPALTAQVNYALPFGSNPFLPSNAKAEFKGFLKPSDFPPASFCQECHADVHQEWRESAHANSFRAPFYLKNVQLLIDGKGIEYTRHCEGCHNPIALFTGALTTGSKVERSFDEDGITCSVCHSIVKLQDPIGLGSYVLGQPVVMVNPDGSPRPGLPDEQDILENPELHKKAVMRDFYRTPEFCAACHKAALPQPLNGYKWLRAFSVYDEWQQSSWSRQSPLPFYKKDTVSTCQTCHMAPVPLKEGGHGGRDGKIASHRFPGASTAIPEFYGYKDQMEAVRKVLNNALALDLFSVNLLRQGREIEIVPRSQRDLSLKPGDEITAELVVTNTKIGHALVPEQRDFYECWVEFEAKDKSGRTFFHSGFLDANGMLDPQAHSYTNRLIDRDGKRLEHHEVWQTRLKAYDNTIMSGRSDLVRYRFRVPAGTRGPVALSARINYRRFRQQYTDFILDAVNHYPIVELASSGMTLPASDDTGGIEPPQRTLLRWNNYGIALLGQQQWWKAQKAFARTTEIDPSYVDGYVNQAIAEYSKWIENRKEDPDGPGIFSLDNANAPPEKFKAALELLEKALNLKPGAARALYYKGLILRLQSHLSEAEQSLMEAVRQYPDFRQGHQELGYVFYLKKDFASAVMQFEAVKRINPDDVTACYYLSIVYEKLGRHRQAKENADLYTQHRDDPNNFALNLEFIQSHLEETRELTPYHIHQYR